MVTPIVTGMTPAKWTRMNEAQRIGWLRVAVLTGSRQQICDIIGVPETKYLKPYLDKGGLRFRTVAGIARLPRKEPHRVDRPNATEFMQEPLKGPTRLDPGPSGLPLSAQSVWATPLSDAGRRKIAGMVAHATNGSAREMLFLALHMRTTYPVIVNVPRGT